MSEIERLKTIVEKLRSEDGCPWDKAQTHVSLKPGCIEEAAEVIGGINILEKTGEIPLTFILVALVFIGQQVYEGVFLQDDISNLSHILGGVVGAVVGYRLNKK